MNNPSEDIEAFLLQRLAERREQSKEEVQAGMNAKGQIDSIEGVELILAAEQAFGVDIPDDILSTDLCTSLSNLASLIRSKIPR